MRLLKIKMALSRLGFPVSYGLEDLNQVKKSELNKQILKDMIYGCLKELGQNDQVYYHSTFGQKYCHVQENAKETCLKILEDFIAKVRQVEEESYQDRKKQDFLNEFKNENTSN